MTNPRYTPLKNHKRIKKMLIPPLNELNIKDIEWKRDWLPDYIWIEGLKSRYPTTYYSDFTIFLDAMDNYMDNEDFAIGLLSDFDKVPEEKRQLFIKENPFIIERVFRHPMGKILSLFPECPAKWLIGEDIIANDEEYRTHLGALSESVVRLYDSKSDYTGDIRMLPFSRFLKHGKIHFSDSFSDYINLLSRYPGDLSLKERLKCQQLTRTALNAVLSSYYPNHDWSHYFWRRNCELSYCVMKGPDKNDINSELITKAVARAKRVNSFNNRILFPYLANNMSSYQFDLAYPSNDEVLLGLLTRILRLYLSIQENAIACYDDISRILLRCMSDSVITYCYLIDKSESELFDKFIQYGDGKEKLLLLQLQDNYPNAQTPGETMSYLLNSIGSTVSPEMTNINLANWIEVSPRDMAIELGMKDVYSIIYDPTSADVHGMWNNLKRTCLTYCINPLHGFHRIPTMRKNCNLQTIDCATQLLQIVIRYSVNKRVFFEPSRKLRSVIGDSDWTNRKQIDKARRRTAKRRMNN